MEPSEDRKNRAPTKSQRWGPSLKAVRGRASHLLSNAFNGAIWLLSQVVRFFVKAKFASLGVLAVIGLGAATIHAGLVGGLQANWPLATFVSIAAIAGTVILVIPRERYRQIFINAFGWFPVTLGAISWPYWYWYATISPPVKPSIAFFEIMAQILPVLLLAAVIDVRRAETLASNQLILPILVFLLGEINALNAIAFEGNYGTTWDFASVSASFVSTVVALTLAVLADITSPSDSDPESAVAEGGQVAPANPPHEGLR